MDAVGTGSAALRTLAWLLEAPVAHSIGDLLVGMWKWCAVANERLGRVGGQEEWVGRRLPHARPVDLEAAHEHGQRLEREARLVPRREDRHLVLLEIAVVREREALDRREE